MLCSLQGDMHTISFSLFGRHSKHPKKREQQFQDVDQKLQYDKKSDTSTAHFAQHFDQKPTPQQCHEIMKFETLSTLNYIRLMKTWSKSS